MTLVCRRVNSFFDQRGSAHRLRSPDRPRSAPGCRPGQCGGVQLGAADHVPVSALTHGPERHAGCGRRRRFGLQRCADHDVEPAGQRAVARGSDSPCSPMITGAQRDALKCCRSSLRRNNSSLFRRWRRFEPRRRWGGFGRSCARCAACLSVRGGFLQWRMCCSIRPSLWRRHAPAAPDDLSVLGERGLTRPC